MKSITIEDEVKDDYDLVKVKVSWELKMKLNDSDFMHLLLEKDINEIRSQERKKSYHKNDHVRKKSYHKND